MGLSLGRRRPEQRARIGHSANQRQRPWLSVCPGIQPWPNAELKLSLQQWRDSASFHFLEKKQQPSEWVSATRHGSSEYLLVCVCAFACNDLDTENPLRKERFADQNAHKNVQQHPKALDDYSIINNKSHACKQMLSCTQTTIQTIFYRSNSRDSHKPQTGARWPANVSQCFLCWFSDFSVQGTGNWQVVNNLNFIGLGRRNFGQQPKTRGAWSVGVIQLQAAGCASAPSLLLGIARPWILMNSDPFWVEDASVRVKSN